MKEKSQVVKSLAMILQIGLSMLCSIFICGVIGYFVDQHFGTNLMIFFIAFGVISGYCGVYSLLKQFIGKDKDDIYATYYEEYLEGEGDEDDKALEEDTEDE